MHIPTMYNYLDAFFKISGVTKDTVVECLLEEMEILRNFHSRHNTLSFMDTETIIGLLRHCLLHDTMAEKRIQNKQCAQENLVGIMNKLLNSEIQGSKAQIRKWITQPFSCEAKNLEPVQYGKKLWAAM